MPVQLPEGSVHALSLQFGGLLVFARFLPMTLLLPGVGGLQIALAARIGLAVVLSCLVAPLVVSMPGSHRFGNTHGRHWAKVLFEGRRSASRFACWSRRWVGLATGSAI